MNGLILLLLLAGKPVGSHTRKAAVVLTDVHRRHRSAEVLRQKLQNIAAQHVQRQLPEHLFGQFALAVAQPCHFLQTLGIDFLQPQICAVGG